MTKLEELQAEQTRIVMEGIKRAVESEREACARIAENNGQLATAREIRNRRFE